jgi:hypothetical protein
MLCICLIYIEFNHSQDSEKTRLHQCNVQFDLYILKNQKRFLYFMLIVREAHIHHSSYSIKLSINIANDVLKIIKKHEILNLTVYMLHICEAYDLCKALIRC